MLVYDVSEFNPDDRVQELIEKGAEGFILRLGETCYGEPLLDEKFIMFVNQVVAAGLPYGIYYVSHAGSDEMFQMEAQWINDKVAELLNGQEPELGTWWDMEVGAVKYQGVTQGLLDAIGTMQAWWGNTKKIGIYAGYSYFNEYLDLGMLADYQIPVWVAQYGYHENSLMAEHPELKHVAWQYTTNNETQDENDWYGF